MGGPVCHVCGQKVDKKERAYAIGRVFHADCLKCHECTKNFAFSETPCDFNGQAVCRSCFDLLVKGKKPALDRSGAVFPSQNSHLFGGDSKFASAGGVPFKKDSWGRDDIKPSQSKDSEGAGTPCGVCKKILTAGSIVTLRDGSHYHRACFRCTRCNEFLSATDYAKQKGKFYCGTSCNKDPGVAPAGYNTQQLGPKFKQSHKKYIDDSDTANIVPSKPIVVAKADETVVNLRPTRAGGLGAAGAIQRTIIPSSDNSVSARTAYSNSTQTTYEQQPTWAAAEKNKAQFKPGQTNPTKLWQPKKDDSVAGSRVEKGYMGRATSTARQPQFDKPMPDQARGRGGYRR